MPTRQPASFNATFSRIAASRAASLQLGAATREKALFIMSRGRGPRGERPLPEGADVAYAPGGLMSYAPNQADLFRRAADFVDKIDHLFGVLFMYRDAIPSSADSPGELFHLWMLSPQVCAKLGYIGETWSTL